jgi:CheY-like chemotaxis protein
MFPLVHLLLVEDDEVEAEFVRRSLQHHGGKYVLHTVPDGLAALQVLRGQAGQPRLCRPYIILLDLNLPRLSGLEFLHALRQDPDLKHAVVFVRTTSNLERDKLAAYSYQIAGYCLKTADNVNCSKIFDLLDAYCTVVAFPREKALIGV